MKKPSLAEALQPMDRAAATTQTSSAPVSPMRDMTPAQQPSRVGKKPLIAYFSPECIRQFKQVALDRGATQQSLLEEAVNDLFQKYGKPPIA